jgi:hypothetical protein
MISTLKEVLNVRRAGWLAVAFLCLCATGCISIEQEIFLNANGTGEVVVLISLPDLPDQASKPDMGPKKNATELLADFKKELITALPPTIKLKEAKEVKQNGVQSLYATFEFKKLEDVKLVLANFGKNTLKEGEIGSDPQWSIGTVQKGDRTFFTQKFLLDVDNPQGKSKTNPAGEPAAKDDEKQKTAETDKASSDLSEQLKPLVLAIFRMRFVLHAPSQITDSNADIVLNGRTAVWNCSLVTFLKEKKPIEMKASF